MLQSLNSQTNQSKPGDGTTDDEEPLYVNAKQYHRILKRRQQRTKLEQEGRIPKQRMVRPFTLVREGRP